MSWLQNALLAFDTETTGKDPETARIVTASVVVVDPDGNMKNQEWLANPGVAIPAEAASVHGISTEYAQENGLPAADVARGLREALFAQAQSGGPIVAYNAAYDITVLDRECRRYGIATLHERCYQLGLNLWVIDPLVIDKHMDKYRRGSRKLIDTARHYGVILTDEEAHTSYGDSLATARVARAIAEKYPEIAAMTSSEIHANTTKWFADQAISFESYLRRQGKNETISREWPIRKEVA